MPAFRITYERGDIPSSCHALKFAPTKEEALKCLCSGNDKKGHRLLRSDVPIKIKDIKEV